MKREESFDAFIERFKSNVVETISGCYEWQGYANSANYGMIGYNYTRILVHRLAYSIWVGDLVDRMVIHHKCGNTRCVKPSHLEQVTYSHHSKEHPSYYRNSKKNYLAKRSTHCKRGHEWNDENTYITPSTGHRLCKQCNRIVMRRRYYGRE